MLAGGVMLSACGAPPRGTAYVGSEACSGCHAAEFERWSHSEHALAMRAAAPGVVAARFDAVTRHAASITARPVAKAAGLAFDVQAPMGVLSVPVPYVLGRGKIEQFLTPGRAGRWQSLPLAFDTRRNEWFDVFPEAPGPDGWAHWQNPGATANRQCLGCHTTNYETRFDPTLDAFDSRWAAMGVGCEACHGPGAAHAAEAARGRPSTPYGGDRRTRAEACAPCHGLRREIAEGYVPGAALDDHFEFDLLDSTAYHADGQISAEAYEWTSFRMSRMYARGVVCADCHDPHAGGRVAEGDALCLGCHAERLATPEHTHHAAVSPGARCVGCHMPSHTFMERDVRHDHQFARPDVETAVALGAPEPCTRCHSDRSPGWAAEQAARWWGVSESMAPRRRITGTISVLRAGGDAAEVAWADVERGDLDPVRRASISRLLVDWLERPEAQVALARLARDPEPSVRAGAVRSLGEAADTATALEMLLGAAADPSRLVRTEAGFALRGRDVSHRQASERTRAADAATEWLASQEVLADLPEPNHSRGAYFATLGDVERAEGAFKMAIIRWPGYLPAREALASVLAETGREAEAEAELRGVVRDDPKWAPGRLALGLLLGKHARYAEARTELEACLQHDPTHPRAWLNLGRVLLGLRALGRAREAFERAATFPESRVDAVRELVRLTGDLGDTAARDQWIQESTRIDPTLTSDDRVRGAQHGE